MKCLMLDGPLDGKWINLKWTTNTAVCDIEGSMHLYEFADKVIGYSVYKYAGKTGTNPATPKEPHSLRAGKE